jgi:hypothetical protein
MHETKKRLVLRWVVPFLGEQGRYPQFRYHTHESWFGSENSTDVHKHMRAIPSFCLYVLMGKLFAGRYNVCLRTSQLILISVIFTL